MANNRARKERLSQVRTKWPLATWSRFIRMRVFRGVKNGRLIMSAVPRAVPTGNALASQRLKHFQRKSLKVAGKAIHASTIIVSGLRPPLYSWFFFLNEANHCSSCFSSLSKSHLAVQPYYKRQKYEGNPEKFLRRRSPYINGHAYQEGHGYIFFVTLRESGKRL